MNEIKHGDSLEVLEQLEPNSVHAFGGFMGK